MGASLLPVKGVAWGGVSIISVQFGVLVFFFFRSGTCCCCFMVWAYSRLQAVAWPVVFLCSLGVHLCTCSVFYLAQHFWHLWFITFWLGFHLPPFPPSSVSFLFCYVLGSGMLGLGLNGLCLIYYFSTELLVSV